MKNLGEYLKSERTRQKLSLEDMAEKTKIHITKLRSIEAGDREALPATVFCVGLVKSYARALDVDMEKVDQLCQEAFAEDEPEVIDATNLPPKLDEAASQDSQPVGLFQVPKIVVIFGTIGLCVALIFFILMVVEKMNSYTKEEAPPPQVFEDTEKTDPVAPAETSSLAKVENEQKVEPAPKPEPKPEEKPEPPPKPTPEPEPTPKPAPEPKPALQPKPEEKPKPVEKIQETIDDSFSAPLPPIEEDEKVVVSDNKLTITALEPVRVEVVWSDGYVQVMLLKSNESKTLVFTSPITLRVNNGGAIKVSFNDGEKKVPGTFNKPIELKYP